MNIALVVGLVVGGIFLIVVILLFLISYCRRTKGVEFEDQEAPLGFEDVMNREFDHSTGPKRYSYSELVRATK